MKTKRCSCCKEEKSIDCFNNQKNKPDGKQCYCRDCSKAKNTKLYANSNERRERVKQGREAAKQRNREYVIDYLVSHNCVDCGESNPMFLDFDHVRGKKILDVSTASKHGWSLEKLKEEVQKCDVRCIKCHRIKTAKDQGWFYLYEQFFK